MGNTDQALGTVWFWKELAYGVEFKLVQPLFFLILI